MAPLGFPVAGWSICFWCEPERTLWAYPNIVSPRVLEKEEAEFYEEWGSLVQVK